MTNDSASTLVFLGIPSLAALIVGLLTIATAVAERKLGTALALANRRAVRNALLAVIWVAVSLGVANTGVLARFDSRPPPLLVFLVLAFSGTIALARSRFGERLTLGLPLWALVGFQAFRLPVELVLHQAASDGIMPVEMSYSGYNFDILSGTSALFVAAALALGWAGKRVTLIWNIVSLLLLCNIVGIAIAATPTFQAFGPDHLNVWVTRPPYVLLPAVLVMAAFFGHALVFRKLGALGRVAVNASSTGSADHRRPGTAANLSLRA